MKKNQTPPDDTRNDLAPETDMSETSYATTDEPSSKHGVLGPVVGILVIVLILILGGLYLWGNNLDTDPADALPAAQENMEEDEPSPAEMDTGMSSSDSIEAIESDIEESDLDEFDAELNEFEAEMDAAMESN